MCGCDYKLLALDHFQYLRLFEIFLFEFLMVLKVVIVHDDDNCINI